MDMDWNDIEWKGAIIERLSDFKQLSETDSGSPDGAYALAIDRLEAIEREIIDSEGRARVEPMDIVRVCAFARAALHRVQHAIPIGDTAVCKRHDGRWQVSFLVTLRDAELMLEAIDTGHGALLSEVGDCDSSGDEEGAELKRADLDLLDRLARPFGVLATIADFDRMRRDSVGAEAPTQDASSAVSGTPLASSTAAADGPKPTRGGGATSGGARC